MRKHENPPEAETKRKAGAYPLFPTCPRCRTRRPESILKQRRLSIALIARFHSECQDVRPFLHRRGPLQVEQG